MGFAALERNKPSGGAGRGGQLDGEAETLQPFDELVGAGLMAAALEVIGAKIAVVSPGFEHVVDRGQHGGGDSADGLLGSAAGTQAVEEGRQVAALGTACGPAALDEIGLQPGRSLTQAI